MPEPRRSITPQPRPSSKAKVEASVEDEIFYYAYNLIKRYVYETITGRKGATKDNAIIELKKMLPKREKSGILTKDLSDDPNNFKEIVRLRNSICNNILSQHTGEVCVGIWPIDMIITSVFDDLVKELFDPEEHAKLQSTLHLASIYCRYETADVNESSIQLPEETEELGHITRKPEEPNQYLLTPDKSTQPPEHFKGWDITPTPEHTNQYLLTHNPERPNQHSFFGKLLSDGKELAGAIFSPPQIHF